MTNTVPLKQTHTAPAELSAKTSSASNAAMVGSSAALTGTQTLFSRESGDSLVDQIVRTVQSRIDDKLLRTGARMP